MNSPLAMKCMKCGRALGAAVSSVVDHLSPLKLEFACEDCLDRTARSKAITLDSETSWGRVMREMKDRF
jgi:hypothetical protein